MELREQGHARRRAAAKIAAVVQLCLVLANTGGCAYEVEPNDGTEGETITDATEEIVQGTLTTRPRWVVQIDATGGGTCTGSVLSENWILTAAHCIDEWPSGELTVTIAPTPGARQEVYKGPVRYFIHPDFDDGHAANDVGLVYLSAHAIDLSLTGRAKLYTDARRPWRDSSLPNDFLMVGWGMGSLGPSGTTDCNANTAGVMRIGYGFDVKVTDDPQLARARWGDTHACDGDSGAPWLLRRGSDTTGYDYFVFATLFGENKILWMNEHIGPLLEVNLAWIEQTMRTEIDPFGNQCVTRSFSGFEYRECSESWRGVREIRGLAGKCMEASGTTHGSLVRLNTCTAANDRQRWGMHPNGEITSAAGSNLCLHANNAANGMQLEIRNCNDTVGQRFGYANSGRIRSAFDYKKCVEVRGGFTTNGTPIQIYDCNGTASQNWVW